MFNLHTLARARPGTVVGLALARARPGTAVGLELRHKASSSLVRNTESCHTLVGTVLADTGLLGVPCCFRAPAFFLLLGVLLAAFFLT